MSTIDEMIRKKSNEIAECHQRIIERECRLVIEKHQCLPEQLIIEYTAQTAVKILIQASHFQISNEFVYRDGKFDKEVN
jgi:hypothetical protein